jgi:hypothetical protein
MSVANGSHCHATIRITDSMGSCANQSIGRKPSDVATQAKTPDTGCINKFFQTRALTVGMTKKGAITMSRTSERPMNNWSRSSARSSPITTVIARTEPTSRKVLYSDVMNAGSVRK